VTTALRLHRLLCRLGFHLPNQWRTDRKVPETQKRACAVCGFPQSRAKPTRKADEFLRRLRETETTKRFPVDKYRFPLIYQAKE
jgi:ribosomal protein L37E